MKKHLLLCSLAVIFMLASCKKDNSANNTGIEGTYKLKYLTSHTTGTITMSSGARIVTIGDYTTTNNQGTIAFNNSILTATGLSYSVDTVLKYYSYDSTGVVYTDSSPYSHTVTDTGSADQYRLIGADSIYFPQGSVITGENELASEIWIGASGGRYSWNGNLLTIIQHYSKDITDSNRVFGAFQANITAVSGIVLEKQ